MYMFVCSHFYCTATASVENSQSPSPHSSTSSPGDSQNPSPSKKSAQRSEVSQSILPVSCQPSPPSTSTKERKFVYCLPYGIPETSTMVTEDYYSGGTGTGDSGVGDIHHHTPSYDALRRKLDHLVYKIIL